MGTANRCARHIQGRRVHDLDGRKREKMCAGHEFQPDGVCAGVGRRIKRARSFKSPGSYRYIKRFCCKHIVQQTDGNIKKKRSTKES